MGIWTWLERHDLPADPSAWDAIAQALLDAPFRSEGSGAAEALHTHRCWHSLHVALTGCELDAPAPGGDVLGVTADTYHHWEAVRLPDQVRVLADFLDAQRPDDLIATLRTATAGDVYVYFESWWDDDHVRALFEQVRAFFRAAADAGQAVVLRRY